MKKNRIVPGLAGLMLCMTASVFPADKKSAPEDSWLEVLQNNYPKAVFYRFAANFKMKLGPEQDYQKFLADYSRLMGFQMDDRILAEESRLELVKRWKQEHPEKVLLWYGLGMALCPAFYPEEMKRFSPGHWVYFPRSTVTCDIPAQEGETDITVEDPSRFAMDSKRTDDLCLYKMDSSGKPDWIHAEQVKLVSIDHKTKTLRVRRGYFSSKPLSFQAGRTAAAPHAYVGPFNNNPEAIVWWYNFSEFCPKDENGKTAGEVYAGMWADKVKPGGTLDFIDGIQLDTVVERVYPKNGRTADINNDGEADNCDIAGKNVFSPGIFRAIAATRAALPAGKLLVPDAGTADSRGFAAANGFESEGLPGRQDPEFLSVFSALNQTAFARRFCAEPRYLHWQHKMYGFTLGENTAKVAGADLPLHYSRMVLAAATMYEAVVTWYTFAPNEPDGKPGVYDELRMGIENRLGWLGKPVGPVIFPAADGPDLLGGKFNGQVESGSSGAKEVEFKIPEIQTGTADLLVKMRVKAAPMKDYPEGYPRRLKMNLRGGKAPEGSLFPAKASDVKTGFLLKDGSAVSDSSGAITVSIEPFQLPDLNHRAQTLVLTADLGKLDPALAKKVSSFYWEKRATMESGNVLALKVWKDNNAGYAISAAETERGGSVLELMPLTSPSFNVAWLRRKIDLAQMGLIAGKEYLFRFSTPVAAGKLSSYWAEVVCATPDADGNMPAGPLDVTQIAWVTDASFDTVFGFRPLQPGQTYDLTVSVEGAEPVTVENIRITNGPGIFCREYENGLVMANLAFHPAELDLSALFPGKNWHRLQAVSTQDVTVNNGQPVSGTVRLDPLDGLFLIRSK